MAVYKKHKGTLSRIFKAVVGIGLLGGALAGCTPAHNHHVPVPPPQRQADVVSITSPNSPWGQDQSYLRESEAVYRSYKADMEALRKWEEAKKLEVKNEPLRRLGSGGTIDLGEILTGPSRMEVALRQIEAEAAKKRAAMINESIREQNKIEEEYRKKFEAAARAVREKKDNKPQSLAQKERQVCEERSLSALRNGKTLPKTDPCVKILGR